MFLAAVALTHASHATRWCGVPATRTNAGPTPEIRVLDFQHRLCRFADGTAVDHPYHDLVPPRSCSSGSGSCSCPDLFIFCSVWFIIVTVFVAGRGCSAAGCACSARCPELLYKLGGSSVCLASSASCRSGCTKLKWLKIRDFRRALMCVALYSMSLAEKMAEVEFQDRHLPGRHPEPFVAVCVVCADAAWRRHAGRASVLQNISPLWRRAVAIPSTSVCSAPQAQGGMRPCKACQVGCGSLAIDRSRVKIRPASVCCASTLHGAVTTTTPARRWQKSKRAKGRSAADTDWQDGYFIPIKQVK